MVSYSIFNPSYLYLTSQFYICSAKRNHVILCVAKWQVRIASRICDGLTFFFFKWKALCIHSYLLVTLIADTSSEKSFEIVCIVRLRVATCMAIKMVIKVFELSIAGGEWHRSLRLSMAIQNQGLEPRLVQGLEHCLVLLGSHVKSPSLIPVEDL